MLSLGPRLGVDDVKVNARTPKGGHLKGLCVHVYYIYTHTHVSVCEALGFGAFVYQAPNIIHGTFLKGDVAIVKETHRDVWVCKGLSAWIPSACLKDSNPFLVFHVILRDHRISRSVPG